MPDPCLQPAVAALTKGLSSPRRMIQPSRRDLHRWLWWFVSLALACLFFLWDLGAIGLVDETPPLFAGAARRMVESGDWLIPSVNGLPRYDKPPLLYWLMALFYGLPRASQWDPLGSWAAALPSALSATGLLVGLASLMRQRFGGCAGLATALAFGLSPLVLLWGRIGVADLLFTALLSAALIASWLQATKDSVPRRWLLSWVALGLAVLAKGPVALLIFSLCWLLFIWLCRGTALQLIGRLRPCRGLSVSLLVCVPWYALALARDGWAFANSFFGYHNLQRFRVVVNGHSAPWWFYGAMLVLASLPITPLLLLQIGRCLRSFTHSQPPTLSAFCVSWLLTVLLFFSLASTKLPSYWLPATPAAALLVVLAMQTRSAALERALLACSVCALFLALIASTAFFWLPLIVDPELPQLSKNPVLHAVIPRAVLSMGIAGALSLLMWRQAPIRRFLVLQGVWALLVPLVLLPLLRLGDGLRSAPLRQIAQQIRLRSPSRQPVVLLGAVKPSLHFYAHRPVAFEGLSKQALVNLADRLRREPRFNSRLMGSDAALLLVSAGSMNQRSPWRPLLHGPLAREGRYQLWRLDVAALQSAAAGLQHQRSLRPSWDADQPERF